MNIKERICTLKKRFKNNNINIRNLYKILPNTIGERMQIKESTFRNILKESKIENYKEDTVNEAADVLETILSDNILEMISIHMRKLNIQKRIQKEIEQLEKDQKEIELIKRHQELEKDDLKKVYKKFADKGYIYE